MSNKMFLRSGVVSILVLLIFQPISEGYISDCSNLPKPIRPHECCQFPQLFRQHALDHCVSRKQISNQCFYECVFEATEIFRYGKFNYFKFKNYVHWVMKPSDIFLPIYKSAYRKCIDKVQNKKFNVNYSIYNSDCNPLPEITFLCVQNEIFASCPSSQWNYDVAGCSNQRNFISNCLHHE